MVYLGVLVLIANGLLAFCLRNLVLFSAIRNHSSWLSYAMNTKVEYDNFYVGSDSSIVVKISNLIGNFAHGWFIIINNWFMN